MRTETRSFSGNSARGHGAQRRKVRCFACGKIGHIAKDCDQFPADDEKDTVKRGTLQTPRGAVHKALCMNRITTSSPNQWHLDSGATDHMTSQKAKLADYRPWASTVVTAGRESLKVLGKGRVEIQLSNEIGGAHITLEDVLYVPELNCNLLSVGRIEERGLRVVFAEGKAEVIEGDGQLILAATREGRLYSVEEEQPVCRAAIADDPSLWHRRLGHLHQAAVRSLCGSTSKSPEGGCDTCHQGKLRRQSFPEGETTRATAPLKLVHSDVVGPITPTSQGGSKYFITFIDDHSRYTTVYPMKAKSEALEKFDQYRRMVENLHGTTIKTLRSDNGGEYTSKKFTEYLINHGIRHHLTVPGTPEQNGTAERMNQTLMDMTRCLLIESGITKCLWADAVVTACHIRNKCPSKAIKGESPEALWTGGGVKYDHLRVFGCRAWCVRNRGCKRKKLDTKGEECVFIGYPDDVKGYKLWNRRENSFFLSRDVVFDENVFPCKADLTTTAETDENDPCDVAVNLEAQEDTGMSENIAQQSSVDCNRRDGEDGISAPLGDIGGPSFPPSEAENNLPTLRRSERLANKKPDSRACTGCYLVRQNPLQDPRTLEEALAAPDGEQWKEAMQCELENLRVFNTWEVVPRPTDREVIKCKWVFRKKYNASGDVERYKARLVACGYSQVEGMDYTETFSPVVRMKSIRALLAVAVERGWEIHQADVTAAYLNGTLKETIYMEQPEPRPQQSRDEVCLLKRSLYGLRQSGREWNCTLDAFLKAMGMKRSKADPCVYLSTDGKLILGVYVDDLLIIAENQEKVEKFKERLSRKFDMKDLGQASHILSIRLRRATDGKLSLDQSLYIDEILSTFGMSDAKGAPSPLNPGCKYKKVQKCADTEHELGRRYRQAVGALLYLAGATRPDLAFVTTYMSQFCDSPSEEHWNGVKHILRYVNRTKSYALTYQRSGNPMQAFCDADWAGDTTDRKSFSGYVVTLAGAAISWNSKKQRTTALSTVEAEYLAMCHAAKELLWFQHFMSEIGAQEFMQEPQVLFADNRGAISLTEKQITSERSKHIDLRYYFLREKIEEQKLSFEYVESSKNLADVFTKVLGGPKTFEHCVRLGLKDR